MGAVDVAGLHGDLVSATRRSLQAGVGGVKNAKEFLKLLIEPSQDDELRRYPWQYFRLVDSSGVVIEDATTNPIKTFREFIESPPLRGLGESMADIERLLADDARALVKLRELVVPVKGTNQYTVEKEDADNISIHSELFTEPEPAKRKADAGTSRAYTLSRLYHERPDLFELVDQGEMSANAAAMMAGWRKAPSALDALQRSWKKASSEEQRQFLEWITNG